MRLTKLIYTASPYSPIGWHKLLGYFIKLYRNYIITRVIGKLQDLYPYAFIGPITQSHHTAKHMKNKCGKFKSWARRDLTYISRCDEVWVVKMSGWAESTGVQEEIKFAQKKKIPVRFIDHSTLRIHD